MKDLDCSVVRDLLPLYAENMVNPDTGRAVAAHLEGCADCRAVYENMQRKIPVPVEENQKKAEPLKRLRFHMILNIISFPIWLPLLLAACAGGLALYVCIWAVVVCLWCVPVIFGVLSVAAVVGAAVSFAQGLAGNGLLFVALLFTGAGLAVLSFVPCLLLSKQVIRLTKALTRRIKALFVSGKEVK